MGNQALKDKILELLGQGPLSVTQLAGKLICANQKVMEAVDELDEHGLIVSSVENGSVLYALVNVADAKRPVRLDTQEIVVTRKTKADDKQFESNSTINSTKQKILVLLREAANETLTRVQLMTSLKATSSHDNLNMRGAFLHVISDLLGSVAAILAALAVKWYGWTWADPLISVLVALLVLRSGYFVLRDALHILMEGTPRQIDTAHIRTLLLEQPDVADIHDLHVWSITSGEHALACHVVLQQDQRLSEVQQLLHRLEALLHEQGISHVTLQVESQDHGHDAQAVCSSTSLQAASHAHDEHEHDEHGHAHHTSTPPHAH